MRPWEKWLPLARRSRVSKSATVFAQTTLNFADIVFIVDVEKLFSVKISKLMALPVSSPFS